MARRPTVTIAMWSGPRNLSTAMMRSFGSRPDCVVWDEPFYAAYLAATGIDHPMRDAVIAAGETDPDAVARRCLAPPPSRAPVFLQKHMTHHILPSFDRQWIGTLANLFLIRAPERVIASYQRKRENPSLDDLGIVQQLALFNEIADRQGEPPTVVDASRVRADPAGHLAKLCARLGLAFDAAMLAWPSGPQPYDGIWGKHWYDSITASTGFAPPEAEPPVLADGCQRLADAARPYYEAMATFMLR